jgi:hypothetical protein
MLGQEHWAVDIFSPPHLHTSTPQAGPSGADGGNPSGGDAAALMSQVSVRTVAEKCGQCEDCRREVWTV